MAEPLNFSVLESTVMSTMSTMSKVFCKSFELVLQESLTSLSFSLATRHGDDEGDGDGEDEGDGARDEGPVEERADICGRRVHRSRRRGRGGDAADEL